MPGLPGIIIGRNNYISWGVVTLASGGFLFKRFLNFISDNSELFAEELSESKK